MPESNQGHTYAGSANWSDTATLVSDNGGQNRNQNQIQRPYSPGGSPRYQGPWDGSPPNNGMTSGTYLDTRTNTIFTVGKPPLAGMGHPPYPPSPFVRVQLHDSSSSSNNPGSGPQHGTNSNSDDPRQLQQLAPALIQPSIFQSGHPSGSQTGSRSSG